MSAYANTPLPVSSSGTRHHVTHDDAQCGKLGTDCRPYSPHEPPNQRINKSASLWLQPQHVCITAEASRCGSSGRGQEAHTATTNTGSVVVLRAAAMCAGALMHTGSCATSQPPVAPLHPLCQQGLWQPCLHFSPPVRPATPCTPMTLGSSTHRCALCVLGRMRLLIFRAHEAANNTVNHDVRRPSLERVHAQGAPCSSPRRPERHLVLPLLGCLQRCCCCAHSSGARGGGDRRAARCPPQHLPYWTQRWTRRSGRSWQRSPDGRA